MSEANSNSSSQPISATLKKNIARTLLCVCFCGLQFLHIVTGDTGYLESIIFILFVAYTISTTMWLRMAKSRSLKKSFFCEITTVDALLVSSIAAYLLHSYPVSATLLCITLFNGMTIGGMRQMLSDAGAYLAGACIVSLALGIQWQIALPTTVGVGLFLGALIYLCYYASFIHHRYTKLNTANKKLYNDLVLHKVRTYKLSRYVTPTVWSALNQGRDASLKTERKRISVFFSDIEGFSSLSEELEAETLTDLLNTYLTEMVKIAAKHRGTIDKFMGDGLMVIFGDTNSDGMKADCLRCVSMAIDMRKKMKELETKWFNQGIKKPLKIRMGINSGYCTVGTFGTSEYMDYTVLGTHVNLASRLESAASSGEILISHETWSLIKDIVMCRDRGEIRAKGFSHPIKVYQVIDFRKDLGRNQSYFEEHMQGFSMHLDLEKVKNYDRSRILEQLENISEKLRSKIH